MDQGTIRQRYDNFRNTTNRGINNINNLGDEQLLDHMDEFQGLHSDRTEELRQSHQQATLERYKLLHVPRMGFLPSPRPHGSFRWMYCQVNGLASAQSRTSKIHDTWALAEQYEVDGIAFVEVGVNWNKFRTSGRLSSWFDPLAEREIRSTEAFNKHGPAVTARQQGGTAILLRHGILEYSRGTAHDSRDLGRWASWVFQSNPDHRTRVITAYCPGNKKNTGPQTVYSQHLNEINHNGLDTSPYLLFVTDLLQAIRCWRAAGDRIILFIDSNEHILRGPLARKLTHPSLGLTEISHTFWPVDTEPNTHVRGSQPIDGIYASPDIEATSFLSLSFHEGVGDHRTMLIDFTTASMIGHYQGHVVRPTSRRLTTKQPSSVRTYNNDLLTQLRSHHIPERLRSIQEDAAATPTENSLHQRAENIFEEIKQYRLCSERNCRKILKPHSPFSLPVKYWYDRIHCLRDLIKLRQGEHPRMGTSRILRSAKRLHIPDAASLSIEDCKEGIRLAIIQQREVRRQDASHRSQHLGNCLQSALDLGDETRSQAIKTRMKNERDRTMWRRINKVTKPILGRSCMQVEVEQNGETITYTKKADIEREIQQECDARFKLGHSAPISHSLLGDDLCYFSHPEIAEQLLAGTYPIPDNMDSPTALLITEMGRIGCTLRQTVHDDIISQVTTQEYQRYFGRIKENTSSSPSGLHLGHDKAAAQNEELAEIFALQMNTIILSGIHPSRWGVALQVMLEKIAGVCLVTKLRSIQLYEADYNWFNKFIFNDGALRALEQSGSLPEEHFSHRGSTAEDACFDKTLTVDISRQSRTPMALISVDAAQCYDRVNHKMMALVWLALQVPFKAVAIIVSCLQYMKILTRTGWGDSTNYFGGTEQKIPFCGLGQGSKAAPASWIQLSSIIVNVYKSMGFGAKISDPITGEVSHTIGCLFVDDTDLYCMNDTLITVPQVAATAGIQLSWWSRFLNATGGAIKGGKSFWYLLAYICTDGIWAYADTNEGIDVPLPHGDSIRLTSKPATHAEKTLGVLTAPCGGHAAQLASIRTKADTWSNRIFNGHLPASHVWRSYSHQLRAQLLYALSTLTNDLSAAQQCLRALEFKLLPHFGVNRHIKTGWRRIHQTFGGVGLIDLPIEQFICRINIFMQHYGTPSALGHKLSTSIHWLQLQLGCLHSPFLLPYSTWSHLAPISWTKCFWETIDKYDVDIRIHYTDLPLQREDDVSIMDFLLPHLKGPSEMAAINRCRCHLNMILLSDMTSLDGRHIQSDMVWGSRPSLQSRMRFPPERPTKRDWSTWIDIWSSATGNGLSLLHPLGRWLRPPHFTWPWRYNEARSELYILDSSGFNVYRQCVSTWFSRSSCLHQRTLEYRQTTDGVCVSVDCIPSPTGNSYPTPSTHAIWEEVSSLTVTLEFWDQIREWGGLWMWEMIFPDVGLGFDPTWMISALRDGTLVAVTDGSYDRKRCSQICAAGWIIMDITTGSRLAGSFSEFSASASSYRGELLGLCAINIILLALSKAGDITNRPPITVWCDNKGAVNRASETSRRIKCGRPCADILRILRTIRHELPLSTTFCHVKAHMDDRLSWEQLSLEQQLNCNCDMLAKDSVTRAIENNIGQLRQDTQLLPKEAVGLFVNKHKITSDPTNELRYLLSKTEARSFLTSEQGWTNIQFDEVGWDWLHRVLATKPVMFRLWLCKQHSNFCATGMQMKRCKLSDDDRCPSCWSRKERARHLCACPSEGRTTLFLENVADLERWLTLNNNTDSELTYWLIKYIQGRGKLLFAELGTLSHDLQQAAIGQDNIGWRNMMEGRVSKQFYAIQCIHLSRSSSRINGDDWMKGLINRLIHISHSQWLFRNFTLHDSQCGYKRLKDKLEVQLQIAELSHTDPDRIPEHSRFLLEIDTEVLQSSDYESQVYWVAAMEAARRARTTALLRTTSTRPALSSFGTFTLKETIRKEIGEMFGNIGRQGSEDVPRKSSASRRTISGINDSDRCRKPD